MKNDGNTESSEMKLSEGEGLGQGTVENRASWSGKLAFVLAAAASAVGLGSMWRFPYLDAHYGGGTFLLVYVIFVFTLGISLLILEVALGRKTGKSVIGAYSSFGRKYRFIGILSAAVPIIITPYYCVIGGWVAKYMFAYLSDPIGAMADGGSYFTTFVTDPTQSVVFMLLFMALTYLVVALGVNGGVEKANLVMMPLLIVVAAAIAIYTMTLPGAFAGLEYYFIPDFSKLSPELIIAALGQTFYALSLAMAIMVTYGSYVKKDISITSSTMQTAGTTFGISILAGLMVVPAAFVALGSGEAVAENSGPSLMFLILPQVFQNLGPAAHVIGFAFFVLVLFAALTSSISLVEACTSIVQDGTGLSRRKSLIVNIVFFTVTGVIVTLGYSSLSFVQPLGPGSTILDFLDFVSNSVMMPIVAFLTCIFVGYVIGPKVIVDEVRLSSRFRFAKAWTIMIKYIAPIVLIGILIASVGKSLGLFSF